MNDTIFALSSGAPPAAIAVIRISGPAAGRALTELAGTLPRPRQAALRRLRDAVGQVLDSALVLWLPGPGTATGEDCAELHLHGGRAVIAAVESALASLDGLRHAEPGEFTRRAFANGRIDLAEAEGLADLLTAETELQRLSAVAMAGGAFSRQIEDWRDQVLMRSAAIEAVLDFGDEDDVAALPPDFLADLEALRTEICNWLDRPRAEALKQGIRVVIAGPPNAGKSTLFNILVESEAAITAPIAGTTRDVLQRSVAMAGIPFQFFDTAGLRDDAEDAIETIGVSRARDAMINADIVLWLGPEGEGPAGSWEVAAQCDRDLGQTQTDKRSPRHRLSGLTGEGVDALRLDLVATARTLMPKPGEAALNQRQHRLLASAALALSGAVGESDPLLIAENLRLTRLAFDELLGRTTTEDMLDTLFSRFCIGK